MILVDNMQLLVMKNKGINVFVVCVNVMICLVIVPPSDLILYEPHLVYVNLKHLNDIYSV